MAFILLIVIAALVVTLNIGDLSHKVGEAKLDAQQNVRRAMEWMIRDLRQTNRMQLEVTDQLGERKQFNLLSNGDIFTEPLFNLCQDYILLLGEWKVDWGNYQIGYSFDATNQRIIRTRSDTNQAWYFNYIDALTFEKIDLNLLRVTITGKKTARGQIEPTFTLEEEVKLRNE